MKLQTALTAFLACALFSAQAQLVQPAPAPAGTPLTPMPETSTSTTNPFSVSQPTQEKVMLWGAVSSEFFILPGLFVGLSGPVGTTGNMNLVLRGSLEVTGNPGETFDGTPVLPFVFGNADLLVTSSRPGLKWYAGPSVGTLMGGVFLVGAVGGVRNEFGNSALGWFAEGKLRAAFVSSTVLPSPGARLGLTYRF